MITLRGWLWLTLTIVAAFLISACDEGRDIIYENRTGDAVLVCVDGLLVHELKPEEVRKVLILKFTVPKLFEAKAVGGNILFSERLSWPDLEDRQFRLVFGDGNATAPAGARPAATTTTNAC